MEADIIINKKDTGKTLKQWLRKGCIPKRGRKGELRYASRASYRKGENPEVYFDPSDVRQDRGQRKESWLKYCRRRILGAIIEGEH